MMNYLIENDEFSAGMPEMLEDDRVGLIRHPKRESGQFALKMVNFALKMMTSSLSMMNYVPY